MRELNKRTLEVMEREIKIVKIMFWLILFFGLNIIGCIISDLEDIKLSIKSISILNLGVFLVGYVLYKHIFKK